MCLCTCRLYVCNDCRGVGENLRLVWTHSLVAVSHLFSPSQESTNWLLISWFAVTCQTTLSLPLAFDLEKVLGKPLINVRIIKSGSLPRQIIVPLSCHICVLVSSLLSGDYYRHEEACQAVQESLSSSSLRRKLFLDGQSSYSGSDSSSPPSPERSHARQERRSLNVGEGAVGGVEAVLSVFSSPLSCGMSAPTPSTVSVKVLGCKKLLFRQF